MKCGSDFRLTIDHVVPKRALRYLLHNRYQQFCSDAVGLNYQTLCERCNQEKADQPADYRKDPKLRQGLVELLADYGVYVKFCVEELVAYKPRTARTSGSR